MCDERPGVNDVDPQGEAPVGTRPHGPLTRAAAERHAFRTGWGKAGEDDATARRDRASGPARTRPKTSTVPRMNLWIVQWNA